MYCTGVLTLMRFDFFKNEKKILYSNVFITLDSTLAFSNTGAACH